MASNWSDIWPAEDFGNTGARLPKLPSVPEAASRLSGWRVRADKSVEASVDGVLGTIMDSAGRWQKLGGTTFDVVSGIASMISSPGMNQVAGVLLAP